MIKKPVKNLWWKQTIRMSFDKCHEAQYRSKYNGREIAWLLITPIKKNGRFGKERNYFLDLTKDPKTRPEYKKLDDLLYDIDNEISIIKAIKSKKKK